MEDAEKSYEDFVKQTTASIEEKSKAIVNNPKRRPRQRLTSAGPTRTRKQCCLSLSNFPSSNCNAELHQSCDFVMKNFKIRQNACDEEITLATRRLRP